MHVVGIGTAAPTRRYEQSECFDALRSSKQFDKLSSRSRAILKKVLRGDNGIVARHLALNPLEEAFDLTPDALHARFTRNAPSLASEAAQKALANANVTPGEIDAVLISTCTGYLCPGLTSYVVQNLQLRPDVFALDLVGQGCGAALPNLRTAEALLKARRADTVLSVCVEVCSAAFYLDDDPGVLISACLFGDGAGAAVLSNKARGHRRQVQWKFGSSQLVPANRDLLRFEHRGGMLRNILSPAVPQLAATHAHRLLRESLKLSGVDRAAITGWILHAGGRDVLSALHEAMDLSVNDTRHSSAVLREFGNLSSPTVYFVLEAALNDSVPDGAWWMSSFGAGFSCHGALLDVRNCEA